MNKNTPRCAHKMTRMSLPNVQLSTNYPHANSWSIRKYIILESVRPRRVQCRPLTARLDNRIPNEPFAMQALHNPQIHVSHLHKTYTSMDIHGSKTVVFSVRIDKPRFHKHHDNPIVRGNNLECGFSLQTVKNSRFRPNISQFQP